MFALIKREISDHKIFFIGAVILAASLTGLSVTTIYNHQGAGVEAYVSIISIIALVNIVLGLFAMGAVQMYTDRIRRISAFVSTLAVSRSRILLARIIAGILAILTALVPLAITIIILLRIETLPVPMYITIARDVFAGTFLLALACYCIGLQFGWNPGKVAPALGGFALTCILVSLVAIKGFAPEFMIILMLFIAASLIRIWHRFTSTSL